MTRPATDFRSEVEVSNFIDGNRVEGDGEQVVNSNPAHPSEIVSCFRYLSRQELDDALTAGERAAAEWRETTIHDRAGILRTAAQLLDDRVDELARDIAREQGRPLNVCKGEVARASAVLRYFANESNASTGAVYASPRKGERILTDRVPLGQVMCITPWNVPLAIPAWKIAPALVHGNTVLWKPSDVTPLVASRLMDVFHEAGLPSGVLNLIFATPDIAETAIRDRRIKAVSFTGSTPVGQHIRKVGAEAGIDVLAEMGGKNAAIVLNDADLEWAIEQILGATMGWSGQRCTATSRVLVEDGIYDDFLSRFRDKVEALTVEDPLLDPDLGPVASARQFDSIAELLKRGLDQGGEAVVGGIPTRGEDDGHFVSPTVVTGVGPENALFTEEIFGPVAVVVRVPDLDAALSMANDGPYGLSGSVFTSNLESLETALSRFDVGVLHVNSESTGAEVHVPFGGFGASGTPHKELGESAHEFFTKTRTIYVRAGRP